MEDETQDVTYAPYPRPSAEEQAVFRRQYAVDAALKFAASTSEHNPEELLRLAGKIDAFIRGEA